MMALHFESAEFDARRDRMLIEMTERKSATRAPRYGDANRNRV